MSIPEAKLDFLREHFPGDEPALKAAAAFLDAWELGHTALRVEASEAEALAKSPLVGAPGGEVRPLVLHGNLLTSWNLAHVERRIAAHLRHLAGQSAGNAGATGAEHHFKTLFQDEEDAQALAARAALERNFTLITGGPGTGKTHTAAKILAMLLLQKPGLRIAIAAPTGKAAQRLGQGIAGMAAGMAAERADAKAELAAVARNASTLHRLLGWNPGLGTLSRHRQRPLSCELLLVDEVSMIDANLWLAVLEALPPGAKLIALGDPGQLESVAPGRVLGSLLDGAAPGSALAACHVELTKNWRFKDGSGIARAAKSVRAHDGDGFMAECRAGKPDFKWARADELGSVLDGLDGLIQGLAESREPKAALEALARLRILCALNRGPWGVEGLGRRIEKKLSQSGVPFARPILVTVNDPASGLFNGDLGVLLPPTGGEPALAVFGTPDAPRLLPETALPAFENAWAMTVHRAQGSEYDEVLLVLPKLEAPSAEGDGEENAAKLLIPELLYTAVTRAKKTVHLAADEKELRRACEKNRPRVTGLAAWLAEA